MATSLAQPPISHIRLKQIANDACNSALASAEFYEHSKTEGWNTAIINTILKSLISESSPSSGGGQPSFKYAVNSTIIQHLVPSSALNKPRGPKTMTTTTSTSTSTSTAADGGDGPASTEPRTEATGMDGKPHVGRRGMHSATGAYWNEKTDGMWSFKYDGGEAKGLDVVISVIWIAI
ncbi:MAG: hypothetical protein M1818_005118 [Claussenomyces sp. TS43310]|nr:MAG: hypothetical protein M1818_005118 [Claussenomyces sp. TS43310]